MKGQMLLPIRAAALVLWPALIAPPIAVGEPAADAPPARKAELHQLQQLQRELTRQQEELNRLVDQLNARLGQPPRRRPGDAAPPQRHPTLFEGGERLRDFFDSEKFEVQLMRQEMERQQREEAEHRMQMMGGRIQFIERWQEAVRHPSQAVMMATQAIVEIADQAERMEAAVEQLNDLLESVERVEARNAIRFALKEIYQETNQYNKALEQMRLVIMENAPQVGTAADRRPVPPERPEPGP